MKLVNILIERIVKLWLLNLHKSCGKPLLIGAEPYGRIGNRLYLGAHLIAWAQRCNAVLIHTGFHDFEHHFEGTYQDALIRFPEPSQPIRFPRIPKRLASQAIGRLSVRYLRSSTTSFQTIDLQPDAPDIAKESFWNLLTTKPITFIRGFVYNNTCTHIVDSYKVIRDHYRPRNSYRPSIDEPINRLRADSDLVLGIVIRHGDFKSWQGGKFYFSTQEYVQLMDTCVEYLPDKNIGFFIASDEDQDPDHFEAHQHFFRSGHPIENLYTLAACDGMIAAESSFTGWSQYYGNVPTWHVRRENTSTSLPEMLKNALEKAAKRKQGPPD